MTSKERVLKVLNHEEADKLPMDFGSSFITGIHCSVVAELRDHYGLEKRPVKVCEPYQMLGEVEEDLLDAMGLDVQPIFPNRTIFGFPNENWKPYHTPWGRDVLVSEHFRTVDKDGDVYIYPQGDENAPFSGHMPKTGYFFDTIERVDPDFDEDDLKDALEEILKLNPKPGNSLSETTKTNQYVIPDFIIHNTNGELELSLNTRNTPELRLSRSYTDMLEAYAENKKDKQKKEAFMFIKQKIDSAKWFMEAIRQRQNTLFLTMNAIMGFQRDYFLSGDETKLKPMILKDIADIVNLDISTISRVANSKYVQTPFGTFLLKSFFSESMQTDSGEEVSTREIKKILSECIESENKAKPHTDEQLTNILKEKGYNIARRTVAKYREQLNIPVARLRKEL